MATSSRIDGAGNVLMWYGQTVDIDDAKRAEALLAGENSLLEQVARGSPLDETLRGLCQLVEQQIPGSAAVVMLLDELGERLLVGAAPSLPPSFARAIDGRSVRDDGGPCGVAVTRCELVVIADIANEAPWDDFRALALGLGLHALASKPILSADEHALGALAVYFREVREPAQGHVKLLDQLGHLAAVAIERKRVDSALRESEARFRGLAQTTPDVMWIIDLDPERMRYSSPSYEQLWDRPLAELECNPRAWADALHPEDRARVLSMFEGWIERGAPERYDIEYRIVRRDASVRWVHARGMRSDDATGTPQRVSGICTDITQRVSAEDALRASEARFALAVEGSNDGLWDWDIVSNQMFLSERAQRLYGLEAGITVRQRSQWRAMVKVHPDDVERQIRLVDDYLAGGPAYDGEWRVRHADGSYRWVRVRGICVRDANGKATRMAGSVSDVDPQKRAEAALLQAQRLEAAGTLAEGVAHDFNNILSAILGYGEMALRDVRPGTRLRRDVDCILVAAERGRSLVDRLLAFSRSNVAERSAVHVESVVRESIDMLAATAPAHVSIEPELMSGRGATLADPTLVHQVFMNLATNAVQAMPSGGTLGVCLERRILEAESVAATGVLPAGSYIVLRVADTGIGIPPEIINRIFDPFFTTKEAGAGTGLGLSLVHGLVSSVGGAVEVTSRLNEGSVFTVYLPDAGEAPEEPDTEYGDLPRGRGERLLVVDDEASLVTLMTDALTDLGYAPVGFTSSICARDALRADPAGFHAMVTDERMPGLSGSELVRLARSLRPDMPIVLASGFLGGSVASCAREAGATEVLQKPLSMKHLVRVLSRVLATAKE